jgi:hypothetical protein
MCKNAPPAGVRLTASIAVREGPVAVLGARFAFLTAFAVPVDARAPENGPMHCKAMKPHRTVLAPRPHVLYGE